MSKFKRNLEELIKYYLDNKNKIGIQKIESYINNSDFIFSKNVSKHLNYYNGLASYKYKDFKSAQSLFEEVLKVDSNHADSNFKYGLLLLKKGDNQQAEKYISKAITLNPNKKSWNKQLEQAKRKLCKGDVGIHEQVERIIKNDIFFEQIKKKLLLIPSDYNERVLVDVIPFIDYYKDDFDIYIMLKNQKKSIRKFVNYTIVSNKGSFADYLRFTSEYVIDAGSLDFFYKITDKNYWVSVWHGIPYKNMFIDFDTKYASNTVRYSRAYQAMISMSNYYTNFLIDSMLYRGHIIEGGCAKIDLLLNEEKVYTNSKDYKILYLNLHLNKYSKVSYIVAYFEHLLNDFEKNAQLAIDISGYIDAPDIIDKFNEIMISKGIFIEYIYDKTKIWKYLAETDFVINAEVDLVRNFFSADRPVFLNYFYKLNQLEINSSYLKIFCNNDGVSNIVPIDINKEIKSIVHNNKNDNINYFKSYYGIPSNKKIILYAPTFRKAGVIALPFDVSRLLEQLNNEYVLLTKLHYLNSLDDKLVDKKTVYNFTDYSNLYDLMKNSDILLSDYSSLIFDYSLLNKPIILFQYDFLDYISDRGVYFDLKKYLPNEQVIYSEEALYKMDFNNLEANNSLLKNKFYPNEKGNSTREIVKRLAFDISRRSSKDIIFLINDLNQIGGIHSFIENMAKYYKDNFNSRIYVIAIKEFAQGNKDYYIFDNENIDVTISAEFLGGACQNILQNTDGIVISLQFSAHMYFQKYLNNVKTILMFHGDTKDIVHRTLYKPHLDWLNNRKIINYDKFLVLSENNKKLLSEFVNDDIKDKIMSVPNSLGWRYQKLPKIDQHHVAYIGRLDDDKNILAVIELARAIQSSKTNIVLNIYGDGARFKELTESVQQFELEEIVIFHGFEQDKRKIFMQNSGLFLVSKSEGLPMVILEAYAYSRPVVVFDSFTSASEIVDDGKTGFLVQPENYLEFINGILLLNQLPAENIEKKYNSFSNDYIFKNYWNEIFYSKVLDLRKV